MTPVRRGRIRRLLPSLLLVLTAAGCAGADDGAEAGFPMDTVAFAPDLGVDLDDMERTPSGLYVQDVVPGEGVEARPGDRVAVHYTGWLPGGRRFDSSLDAGEPFIFDLGAGRVIAGWDEGVAGMREGGERLLVIPPELGYGAQGAGNVIPGNTPLVFRVELLEVR